MTGGCACGLVRFTVEGKPFDAGYCHCHACRRATGAPVLAWANFNPSNFTVTQGAPASHADGEAGARAFCRDCGSNLYWQPNDADGLVSVAIGALDEPQRIEPKIHQWCSNKLPWFTVDDALPRIDGGTLPHPDRR